MKKIINGKKYDTDTAKRIAAYSNCERGFSWFEEVLFLKRTGEFFLYGQGGPMTKYSEPTYGGNREGGQRIIPYTECEARVWAEKYLDGDEYETIFGEVEE